MTTGHGDRLLDGLNHSQLEAVTASGGPVVVLAGAGSGKTRVLTRRIAWRILQGETDPNRVLTLTFTRKAANELRDRQRALGLRDRVPAGTFHSIALAQLRQRWAEKGTTPPNLLDRKVRFVAQLLDGTKGVEATDVVAEIDWARARMIAPESYGPAATRAGRRPPIRPDDLAELMVRYQQEKRRRRVVDFDDLLTLAIRDLRADPDYAAAVRWRHRHFYVDEFQDVNPLQYALLEEWLGDRTDLFLVGDPNQAIYGWNGADPGLIDAVAASPHSTVVRLDDNYRSTPQILGLAAAVGSSAGRAPVGAGQRANRAAGSLPTITSFSTDRAEAAGIADAVHRIKTADGSWSDQAVLVRTNAQLVLIEQALHELRIPARVRSGPGPLGSPEVKAELRVMGRDGVDLISCLEELDERLGTRSATDVGARVDGAAMGNLAALSAVVHDYIAGDDRPTGSGLLAWLDTLQQGDLDAAPGSEAVDLATFHGAKGLEWPVVHVAGMEDGFVPIAYATTEAQGREEQRLLYVALTRAKEELHLSWAAERTFGVTTVRRDPSPHLVALDSALDDLRGGERRPVDWRFQIERTRGRIAEPAATPAASDDRPGRLLGALRSWRATKARAAGVPPHVILDDRTLHIIAERRPAGRAQLAALPGIRPIKLARYGDELLAMLDGPATDCATITSGTATLDQAATPGNAAISPDGRRG